VFGKQPTPQSRHRVQHVDERNRSPFFTHSYSPSTLCGPSRMYHDAVHISAERGAVTALRNFRLPRLL
jgi:hypothetical protein